MKLEKKNKAFVFSPDDFNRLGIKRDHVEMWEDGMRTDGRKGNFEWWYFDVALENGNTLVIVFYTKNMIAINTDIRPLITINLTNAEGKDLFSKVISVKPEAFSSSTVCCDVRIGKNRCHGNLREYHIQIDEPDVKADLTLVNTVESYRPGTGHSFFQSKNKENYFAWLPAVPQGQVTGTLTLKGKTQKIVGSGYHDHNWGDAMMTKLLHHWYWGRAEVGPYTIINAHMVATPKYEGATQDIMILFKDGKLIAENPEHVTCTFGDEYLDGITRKPVANSIIYDFNDGVDQYKITYTREKDITRTRFIDLASGVKRLIGRLIRFDGAYLRFSGTVSVVHLRNGSLMDQKTSQAAVWELMYFGHATPKK